MSLQTNCPECQSSVTGSDLLAGHTAQCPRCGATIKFPMHWEVKRDSFNANKLITGASFPSTYQRRDDEPMRPEANKLESEAVENESESQQTTRARTSSRSPQQPIIRHSGIGLVGIASIVMVFVVCLTTLSQRGKRQVNRDGPANSIVEQSVWPPNSIESQSIARVKAFSEAAYRAETQAHVPGPAIDLREQFAQYRRDLKDELAPHCVDDAWKSLAGAIGSPPTFDPSQQSIAGVRQLVDGRVEVLIRDSRAPSYLAQDTAFQLLAVGDQWLVKRFFQIGRGPPALPEWNRVYPRPPAALHLPKPAADLATLIPELATRKRKAIALHPYRDPAVPADSSHFGGLMLGNSPARWPRCEIHDSHHIGVLQLLRDDFPEIGFIDQADVFQLTWCPFDHDLGMPEIAVRWLRKSELPPMLRANPEHRWPVYDYLPQPSRVYADRYDEFPDILELTHEAKKAICSCAVLANGVSNQDVDDANEEVLRYYHENFGPYDGTKLLGHASWIQSPETPTCKTCQQEMELLLSIQSWEPWSEQSTSRKPIGLPPGTRFEPLAMMFGDAGCIYLFICRTCEQHPVFALMQCS